MSDGETLGLQRDKASAKSETVTGRSTSSRVICRICSGLLPEIFLLIDIIAASLKQFHQTITEWYKRQVDT